MMRALLTPALCLAIAACASSSQLLTGEPRAAITPEQVRVYTAAPLKFQEIAVLDASRNSISTAGGEKAIAKMIESMRAQAARLGANGLLLEDFSDADPVSLGTGVGSQTFTHNGSIDIGVGASFGLVRKAAKARAIFVERGP